MLQPVVDEARGLELLALHDEGKAGVAGQERVIELGHLRAARPVPELHDRRHQPDADHVVDKTRIGEQLQGRWMGGGGARVGLRSVIHVEETHTEAVAADEKGNEKPDRPSAGDENKRFFLRHPCDPTTTIDVLE